MPNATAEEMKSAVEAAKEAYKTWSKTSILTRQQIMFKYQDIIRKNMVGVLFVFHYFSYNFWYLQRELAESVTLEQGKTLADAEGDVLRGLRKIFFLLKRLDILCKQAKNLNEIKALTNKFKPLKI